VRGNDSMAKQFGVEGLPVTFLIDRQGRVAATYAGLVDKENVEGNIKAMLAKQ
jgi:glutathione peroxidase-family protein